MTKRRVLLGRVSMPKGYGRVTGRKEHDLCLDYSEPDYLSLLVWNRINTDTRVCQRFNEEAFNEWSNDLSDNVKSYLREVLESRNNEERLKELIPAFNFSKCHEPQPYNFEAGRVLSTAYDSASLFAQNPY